jgi:tetratricopeptide (TPR) repeat protein
VNPAVILWQRTIDVKYERLLSVQDEIAQQLISDLELRLTPAEAASVHFDNAIDRVAYEDYLRGVDLYATNDFRSAVDMLEQSAARAPNYALTWAHLGRAYTTSASLAFGGREQYVKAQSAYEKALRLNPALVELGVYMANLFTDTGRVEQALPLLKEALHINPNSAEAHWELGYTYWFAGLLPESVTECERARQLDPQVKLHSSALNSYLYLGQYEKFLASLPSDQTAYILFYRGFGDFYLHRQADAAKYFERAYQVDPSLLQAEVGAALRLALEGRKTEGLRLIERTLAKVRERGVADAEGIYKIAPSLCPSSGTRVQLSGFYGAPSKAAFSAIRIFRPTPSYPTFVMSRPFQN